MSRLESLPTEIWDLILDHIILSVSIELNGLGGELINLHRIAGLVSASKTLQHAVWSYFARKPFKPLIPGVKSFAHYLADRVFGDSVLPFSIAIGTLLKPSSPADHPTLPDHVALELIETIMKALLFSRSRKAETQIPCTAPPTGPWDYSLEPMSRKVVEYSPAWVELVLVVKCQMVAFYLRPSWFDTRVWRDIHREMVRQKMQKIIAAITYKETLMQSQRVHRRLAPKGDDDDGQRVAVHPDGRRWTG